MLIGRSSIDFKKLLKALPFKIGQKSKWPPPTKETFLGEEYSLFKVEKYLNTLGELKSYTRTDDISFILSNVVRNELGIEHTNKISSSKRNLNKLLYLRNNLQWLSKNSDPKTIIAVFNNNEKRKGSARKEPIEELLHEATEWVHIGKC